MTKETASGYQIESRELVQIIGKCQSVIALGDKAESNSISLIFDKRGLGVEAANSVAGYQSSVTAKIAGTAVRKRVSVLPELLLSYAANFPQLVLYPKEDTLSVRGGKGFAASIYYVGAVEEVQREELDEATDISKVSAHVNALLSVVGGIKNRTDKSELGVLLQWDTKELSLVVGDTHHVILAQEKLAQKTSGELVLSLANLRRVMDIGNRFSFEGNVLKVWNDAEFLTLSIQTDSLFLADKARDALSAKRRTIVEVSTDKFREMVNVITAAIDETASVMFSLSANEIKGSINTSAGRAVKRDKPTSFKGKEQDITVSIHHLRDCLAAMKAKTMRLVVYDNMLSLECENEHTKFQALMSAMAAI